MAKPQKSLVDSVQWYDSPRTIALRAVEIAVGTVLVLFIAAVAVVPRLYGGMSLTVLSGSMQPSLNPGDIIAVRGVTPEEACGLIGINEIVTFYPESNSTELVTHRVVSKEAGLFPDGTHCRFLTQGDANNVVDELVSPEQIRGKFMYGIPKVGWGRDWLLNHRTASIGILGLIALAAYLWPGGRDPVTKVIQFGDNSAEVPPMPIAGAGTWLDTGPPGVGAISASGQSARVRLELLRRELELREREMRLREAEAHLEFGYQPPAPEDFMTI